MIVHRAKIAAQHGINVKTDWNLGAATLTSVTACRAWNWYPRNDGDSTSLDAGTDFRQSNNQRQVSQELRVASGGDRRVDYIAGLYYLYQSIEAEAVNLYGCRAAERFLPPATNAALGAAALNRYNGVNFFTNAAKVRTRGVEADLRAAPTRWLTLYGSGTYDDARYISYANAPCPIEITRQAICDLSGRRLPGVSKWATSAGGEIRAPLAVSSGHKTEVYLGSDYSYRSGTNTSASLSRYSAIPAYDLVNIRFGVRALNGVFDIQFWGRNITDETWFLSRGAGNTGAITGTLGDPRVYGITLRTKL